MAVAPYTDTMSKTDSSQTNHRSSKDFNRKTVTDLDIRLFAIEAGQKGDHPQAVICLTALGVDIDYRDYRGLVTAHQLQDIRIAADMQAGDARRMCVDAINKAKESK